VISTPFTMTANHIARLRKLASSGDMHRPVLEFGFFLGSTTVFQFTRLLLNLTAAAVLLPGQYGVWGLVVVILTYTQGGAVGIINGANRQIPIMLGAGDAAGASHTERVSLAGTIVTGLLVGALVGMLVVPGGGAWQAIALPLAAAVAFQQLYLFYQMSLRSRLAFNDASAQQLLLAVFVLAAGLPLLLLFGLQGLVLSQAAAFAVGSVIVFILWRRSVRPVWDADRLKQLAVNGFPIMLNGLVYNVLTSTDRWVIAGYGTPEQLGHYTLAATLGSGGLLVSTIIAQQFYPRMALAFGKTGRARTIWGLAVIQSLLAAALVAPVAAILTLAGPVLIPSLLPRYVASVGALQVLSLAYLVLSALSGFTNLLVTVGKSWQIVVLQPFVIALLMGLSVIALGQGMGIVGVALAALSAFTFMLAACALLAWRASRD
jgi:O-antigen/teichoic acid export membrane protein